MKNRLTGNQIRDRNLLHKRSVAKIKKIITLMSVYMQHIGTYTISVKWFPTTICMPAPASHPAATPRAIGNRVVHGIHFAWVRELFFERIILLFILYKWTVSDN